MLTAIGDDRRITPRPGGRATCPGCHGSVVAKCGRIVAWHWAHVTGEDCDPWAEPDSAWHRGWQERYPIEQREVVIGDHRADIVTTDGEVLEFQHSSLSVDEIAAREGHYGSSLFWVFDAVEAVAEERLIPRRRRFDAQVTFRWKWPRKSIAACRRPVFLDLGGGHMLRLTKLYVDRAPHGGLGWLHTVRDFLELTGAVATSRATAPTPIPVEYRPEAPPASARICSRILISREADDALTVDGLRSVARRARNAGLWDERMRSQFTARRLRIEARA